MRVLLASWAYPPVIEGGLEVVPVDGTTAEMIEGGLEIVSVDGTTAEIHDALTAGAITRAG